jgi:hypothetical protein
MLEIVWTRSSTDDQSHQWMPESHDLYESVPREVIDKRESSEKTEIDLKSGRQKSEVLIKQVGNWREVEVLVDCQKICHESTGQSRKQLTDRDLTEAGIQIACNEKRPLN